MYTESKKITKRFYVQKSRHFTERKTICVMFYIQRARQFMLRHFSYFFEIGIYTKIMTLLVMWHFYIQKPRHFAKSKTICVTFLYTKSLTLYVTWFFMEFLKLAEGEEICTCKKALCVSFLYAKKNALCVMFLCLRFIVYYWYLNINTHTIILIILINKFELFIYNCSYSHDK